MEKATLTTASPLHFSIDIHLLFAEAALFCLGLVDAL
jgi:hypothetical protein